jgi:hypothetical protein
MTVVRSLLHLSDIGTWRSAEKGHGVLSKCNGLLRKSRIPRKLIGGALPTCTKTLHYLSRNRSKRLRMAVWTRLKAGEHS